MFFRRLLIEAYCKRYGRYPEAVCADNIAHERTCGTVMKRGFGFPGRSWIGHFRNEKRTGKSSGNREE